jgi:plasmid stabilization system protein ParE
MRPRAAADVIRFAGTIARTVSVRSATNWRHRIDIVIRALATDADQWPEADEAGDLGIDLRCRLFGRRRHVYRILFTIDGDTVHVHRVIHAAQDRLQPGEI